MSKPENCQGTAQHLSKITLVIAAALLTLAPLAHAQSSANSQANPSAGIVGAGSSQFHYTWIEDFEGSSNADGQVTLLDSQAGFQLGKFILVDAGLPIYFVHATLPATSGSPEVTNSFAALGDVYAQVRVSLPNPFLNFSTQLTGRAPTGSTSDGISTGHATYDWTNRIDHHFLGFVPFLEVGIADSIPDAFIYQHPYASYGNVAHIQAGAAYHFGPWVTVAASGYDIAPWGTQTIFSRVHAKSSPGRSGRVFEQNPQTTGGASIAQDDGFSAGLTFAPFKATAFSVGYTRSIQYDLNTISFGVTLNMRALLHPSL